MNHVPTTVYSGLTYYISSRGYIRARDTEYLINNDTLPVKQLSRLMMEIVIWVILPHTSNLELRNYLHPMNYLYSRTAYDLNMKRMLLPQWNVQRF